MTDILCLSAEDAEKVTTVSEIDSMAGYLTRSDELEENTLVRQVIPYVIVRRNGMVLSYQRKGQEDRLHAFRSIGIGGHVDFPETVESGLVREMEEEIGVTVDFDRLKHLGFIRMSDSPVNKVHLCVIYSYDLGDDDFTPNEDEILDPQWINMISDQYEPWSIEAWRIIQQV